MTEERRVTLEPRGGSDTPPIGGHGGTSEGPRFLRRRRYSIDGIVLHAYTHVAHESGFDLGR
jgi:hypothetical protein